MAGGLVTRNRRLTPECPLALSRRSSIRPVAQIHRGVYATFTGPLTRARSSGRLCSTAGPGAQLSHESAAEIFGSPIAGRRSSTLPFRAIGVSVAPQGVRIHISSSPSGGWRFARGIPPHTFAAETVIDLVHAATDLNDVIACVTGAFGRKLASEERLRREVAVRKKLRWRGDLDEIILAGAGGAHSVIEYRYDRDVERRTGCRRPPSRPGSPSRTAPGISRSVLRGVRAHHRARRQAVPPRRAPWPRPGPRQRRHRNRRINAPLRLDRRHPQAMRLGGPGARRAQQSAATPDRCSPARQPAARSDKRGDCDDRDAGSLASKLVALAGATEHDFVPGGDGGPTALGVLLAARALPCRLLLGRLGLAGGPRAGSGSGADSGFASAAGSGCAAAAAGTA